LAGLFVLGALVQYNDPDPVRWIAIYIAAAVAVLVVKRWLAAGVAVAALCWAGAIAAGGLVPVEPGELVAGMKTQGVEEWREMLGLLIIAAGCGAAFMSERPA